LVLIADAVPGWPAAGAACSSTAAASGVVTADVAGDSIYEGTVFRLLQPASSRQVSMAVLASVHFIRRSIDVDV